MPGRRLKNGLSNILRIAISILIVLVVVEMGLRMNGSYRTYAEKTSGEYVSMYGEISNDWFDTYEPNTVIKVNQSEFAYELQVNKFGFIDPRDSISISDTITEIFVFGDSFTESRGVPAEKSWPLKMQGLMADSFKNKKVFNLGIAGSDPLFAFANFKRLIPTYTPDTVIVVINTSDLTDVLIKGGMERFRSDGTLQCKKGPAIENYYRRSHIMRALLPVFGYDPTLMKTNTNDKRYNEAVGIITSTMLMWKVECKELNTELIVVIDPTPIEYDPAFEDKMRDYLNIVKTGLEYTGISTIDLKPQFDKVMNEDNFHDYMYKIDGHFNAKGYNLFAELLFKELH